MPLENEIKILDGDDLHGILTAAFSDNTNTGEPINELKEKTLAKWGIVEFTNTEIQSMPKTFKRIILLQKKQCHLRTRKSGNGGTTYEIRFRRDGFDVHACGKTIERAKQNFIEKLKTAKPVEKKKIKGGGFSFPDTFTAFALYHFENFKKEKVSPEHYSNILSIFTRYLAAHFKERKLNEIAPLECKTLIDGVKAKGKGKTADDLHSILNGIFKNACNHKIIENNPIALISYVKHERESGCAISREEENTLFNALNGSIFETAAALGLYCGLRPNEMKTAQIKGDFIKAINSKRKNGKIEYKLIPIIDRLRPHLPCNGVFDIPNLDMYRRAIKKALPNHKAYDLRTTFYTRCDELGVAPPARDEYVGHSAGVLTNTYRDLSKEYLLKEGQKLNSW